MLHLHFWLDANFIFLYSTSTEPITTKFNPFQSVLLLIVHHIYHKIKRMQTISGHKWFKMRRTEGDLTKRFTAVSRSEICCAHLRHCAEQSAWLKVGKLSINTKTYHSIIHWDSCGAREENIKQVTLSSSQDPPYLLFREVFEEFTDVWGYLPYFVFFLPVSYPKPFV